MDRQEKSESSLLESYRQLMTVILMMVLLAVLAFQYFGAVPNIAGQGLRLDYNRWLNVLGMLRSQWQGSGQPNIMAVSWIEQITPQSGTSVPVQFKASGVSRVTMSSGGWPLPEQWSTNGCEALWQKLLGVKVDGEGLQAEYRGDSKTCRYFVGDGASVNYQLTTGQVVFLTQ
ncbi:MSHA biogenesis protein MshF [Shewanella sp. NFH-SH190041]|uniref:MSHA biogenesis protein MshF n=1 Tax=Shewanella sp. NFH-SH190041 TaxID=2950245 RepID=UPI0021C2DCAD|nr:MSHA biogenesis protein MshF [Shewanella sp. NFH-SH190041]BDM63088.1 MSHA biogenesis protein MshF [Shewanella sp. NFH-SH190041]